MIKDAENLANDNAIWAIIIYKDIKLPPRPEQIKYKE